MLTIQNFSKIRGTDLIPLRAFVEGVEEGATVYNFTITYNDFHTDRISIGRMLGVTNQYGLWKNGSKIGFIHPSNIRSIPKIIELFQKIL